MELQGNIEASIGKSEIALKTFQSAIELIDKFDVDDLKDIKNNIRERIRELKKQSKE